MIFENSIINLFSKSDKVNDSYKDVNGKGLLERYNEIIGSEIDEEILPTFEQLIDEVLIPMTCEGRFIGYLEERNAIELFITNSEFNRRRVINNIHRLYQIRCTKTCTEFLLRLLGFTNINIIESYERFRFDESEKFDSTQRTFDMNCFNCSNFEIHVETTDVVDAEMIRKLNSIIDFNKPVNLELKKLKINDIELISTKIFLFINSIGDLIFYNEVDPELFIFIDGLGNFIIQGPNADRYSINELGFLIYN